MNQAPNSSAPSILAPTLASSPSGADNQRYAPAQSPESAARSLPYPRGLSNPVLSANHAIHTPVQAPLDGKNVNLTDNSVASVQVLARLISDQVNRISAMNKVSDEMIKLQEIERKDMKDWPHNDLVHWIVTFRNKKFSKFVGNFINNNLDGHDMVHLSQEAMIKLCDGDVIRGELLFKFSRLKSNAKRFDASAPKPSIGQKLKQAVLVSPNESSLKRMAPEAVEQPALPHGWDATVYATGPPPAGFAPPGGGWVKRKRRCKVAQTVRDLVTYIDSFERIMKKGRLSMNAAAEQVDAPISRGSYRNYLKLRKRVADMGYDLTDPKVLESNFKDLLKSGPNHAKPTNNPMTAVNSMGNVPRQVPMQLAIPHQ